MVNPQVLRLPAHDHGSQNSGLHWAFFPSLWQVKLLRSSPLRMSLFQALEDNLTSLHMQETLARLGACSKHKNKQDTELRWGTHWGHMVEVIGGK